MLFKCAAFKSRFRRSGKSSKRYWTGLVSIPGWTVDRRYRLRCGSGSRHARALSHVKHAEHRLRCRTDRYRNLVDFVDNAPPGARLVPRKSKRHRSGIEALSIWKGPNRSIPRWSCRRGADAGVNIDKQFCSTNNSNSNNSNNNNNNNDNNVGVTMSQGARQQLLKHIQWSERNSNLCTPCVCAGCV